MAEPCSQPVETFISRVREIRDLLEEEYGRPTRKRRLGPLDELILTILSQHTSDVNSERAFDTLRATFPTWEAVRDAEPTEIAEAIKSGGLAQVKAKRIKALLVRLSQERGSLSLDHLCEMELDAAREWLLQLEGVGPKTAACVLLFSCGMPAFPVDTHVHRVCWRLGLIQTNVAPEDAHTLLEGVVPPQDVLPFHLNLVTHGRQVCKAQRPRCEACVLAPKCDYFATRQ